MVRIVLVIVICGMFSCNQERTDSSSTSNKTETCLGKKHFGERLSLVGDFDGNGSMDTVYESYVSSLTGSETDKVQDDENWENNIELIMKNVPICRLYISLCDVDTFIVSNEVQQAGLIWFRNLGDLNDDGKDEIGYAINWTDQSNINTYHVLSLRNNKFEEVFNFRINEMIWLYADQDFYFENGEFIQKAGYQTCKFKFFSDSATVETGIHHF